MSCAPRWRPGIRVLPRKPLELRGNHRDITVKNDDHLQEDHQFRSCFRQFNRKHRPQFITFSRTGTALAVPEGDLPPPQHFRHLLGGRNIPGAEFAQKEKREKSILISNLASFFLIFLLLLLLPRLLVRCACPFQIATEGWRCSVR